MHKRQIENNKRRNKKEDIISGLAAVGCSEFKKNSNVLVIGHGIDGQSSVSDTTKWFLFKNGTRPVIPPRANRHHHQAARPLPVIYCRGMECRQLCLHALFLTLTEIAATRKKLEEVRSNLFSSIFPPSLSSENPKLIKMHLFLIACTVKPL